MRIVGVNLPLEKRVEIGLQSIYGVGKKVARDICENLAIPRFLRVKNLTDQHGVEIRRALEKYCIEGDLRRQTAANVTRLKDLGCYRGIRHRRKLPVRGQRTHSNGRTRKGKAVAIAGKKK